MTDEGVKPKLYEDDPGVFRDTQEVRLTGEVPPLLLAVTTPPFARRVCAGIDRLERTLGECGFAVLSSGSRLIYSPVIRGTALPSDMGVRLVRENAAETPVELNLPQKYHKNKDKLRIIARFHFHPRRIPFSEGDITSFERLISGGKIEDVSADKYYLTGVFLPQIGRRVGKKPYTINSLQCLFCAGHPSSFEYQGTDIGRLSAGQQVELFRGCGLQAGLVDIPFTGRNIDLSLLEEIIREQVIPFSIL